MNIILFHPQIVTSYIRKGKYCPATPPPPPPPSRSQRTRPGLKKRGGLESSGQRLISSNGKTKRIAFFFGQIKIISKLSYLKEKHFSRQKNYIFKILGFKKKKKIF